MGQTVSMDGYGKISAHMDGSGCVDVVDDGDRDLIALGGNDLWTGCLTVNEVH